MANGKPEKPKGPNIFDDIESGLNVVTQKTCEYAWKGIKACGSAVSNHVKSSLAAESEIRESSGPGFVSRCGGNVGKFLKSEFASKPKDPRASGVGVGWFALFAVAPAIAAGVLAWSAVADMTKGTFTSKATAPKASDGEMSR